MVPNNSNWSEIHSELRPIRDIIFLVIDIYRGCGIKETSPIIMRMKEIIMLPTKYQMLDEWEKFTNEQCTLSVEETDSMTETSS